mgnify:CR=1 FL=1
MKFIKLGLLLILFLIILSFTGCEKSLENKINGLTSYISENKIGKSSNVFLEMQSLFGGWDKVVLFFGFMDDFKNCEELKEHNQRKYPEKKYRCVLAN